MAGSMCARRGRGHNYDSLLPMDKATRYIWPFIMDSQGRVEIRLSRASLDASCMDLGCDGTVP